LPRADAFPEETPVVVGTHIGALAIEKVSGNSYAADTSANQSLATQLAFGPGPDPNKAYLYVASDTHPVRRFEVDSVTGTLTNRVDVLPLAGLGIAFRSDSLGRSELYLSSPYLSENAANAGLSRLIRFVDVDGDGVFNGVSDVNASIAHGIPADGHTLNQIQIAGDTLYVGSGTRTQNGGLDTLFSGDLFGDSAYSGAILVIDDLELVPTSANAAGFSVYLAEPTLAEYEALINGTTAGAEAPFTSTAVNKLRVHSAGLRNPFGVALDRFGSVWITNNFQRVNRSVYDRSMTGAAAEPDAWDGPSNDDVHDQMFRAVAAADYGFRNSNWQSTASALGAGFYAGIADPTRIEVSTAFDNLDQDGVGGPDFDSLDPALDATHNPANPIGLGPHAGVTGLAFNGLSFSPNYHDKAFVARWSGMFPLVDGLDYRDIVLVDTDTGEIERAIENLNAPTDIVADADGNLFVANYFGSIWRITEPRAVPAMSGGRQVILMPALVVCALAALRAERFFQPL
jgi:glucose/arabinose dehydrogenase